jgi:hypothetical protein
LFLSNPGRSKVSILFSASMVIIFLGLGCFFIFTDVAIDTVPRPRREYVGYVLGGWALFRGVSVWMRFRRAQQEEQENDEN